MLQRARRFSTANICSFAVLFTGQPGGGQVATPLTSSSHLSGHSHNCLASHRCFDMSTDLQRFRRHQGCAPRLPHAIWRAAQVAATDVQELAGRCGGRCGARCGATHLQPSLHVECVGTSEMACCGTVCRWWGPLTARSRCAACPPPRHTAATPAMLSWSVTARGQCFGAHLSTRGTNWPPLAAPKGGRGCMHVRTLRPSSGRPLAWPMQPRIPPNSL